MIKLEEVGALPGMANLLCPHCGYECMHPFSLVVNAGGSITTVTQAGTAQSKGEPEDRGVSIMIGFCCEEGHVSEMKFHFHKGNTGVSFEWDGVEPAGYGLGGHQTIWRD